MTPEGELPARDALVAELGVLRALVRGEDPAEARAAAAAARSRLTGRTGLDEVAEGFGLTSFERATLLLAAGPELVAAVGDELAALGAGPRLTFGTALALLPGAHWSAIVPPGPLRRWELLRPADPSSPGRSPLVLDERVLHHLAGAGHLDARLAAVARPLPPPAAWLPESLGRTADEVAAAWRQDRTVLLHGPQAANVRAVVAAAAERTLLTPLVVAVPDLPGDPLDRERLLRRMERETVLAGHAWVLDAEAARPAAVRAAVRAVAGLDAPVAVLAGAGGEPERAPDGTAEVRVPRASLAERRVVLGSALRRAGAPAEDAAVDAAAGVFDLSLDDVERVAREVAAGTGLWPACRAHGQIAVGALATVRTPRAGWADLVLPPAQHEQLRGLVASVRGRARVHDDWGFAGRSARGLGAAALFAGPSGTGKTLAAEVVAGELGLDLVQVDLGQVVSKWIGETEKQLGRLFDAAEDGGCVLLFDEADTLFGRRSEVRDSHDRYANLEVGYLLQRMESFAGLAILTTNARSSLDPAFLRRLRVIVSFPYPDAALRKSLWERAFPEATPLAGVDPGRLAELDLPGGGIAAVALTAAYLAADAEPDRDTDSAVTAADVDRAARWELAKTGRTPAPTRPRSRGGGR